MSGRWEAVPAELRALPQWVVWRFEERDDRPKPTKVTVELLGEAYMVLAPSDRPWRPRRVKRSSRRSPTYP